MQPTRAQVQKLIGKRVMAQTRKGDIVIGKLLEIKGNRLFIRPDGGAARSGGRRKPVRTSFIPILPLVLFDLLVIAEVSAGPFWGGGWNCGGYPYSGYGGYGGFGGYPYKGGFKGGFW